MVLDSLRRHLVVRRDVLGRLSSVQAFGDLLVLGRGDFDAEVGGGTIIGSDISSILPV